MYATPPPSRGRRGFLWGSMRPTVKLLLYLASIVAISYVLALVITPWVPYDFFKVGRRVATIAAALLLIPFVRHGLGWRTRQEQYGHWKERLYLYPPILDYLGCG